MAPTAVRPLKCNLRFVRSCAVATSRLYSVDVTKGRSFSTPTPPDFKTLSLAATYRTYAARAAVCASAMLEKTGPPELAVADAAGVPPLDDWHAVMHRTPAIAAKAAHTLRTAAG